MSSTEGSVYILVNEGMPGLVKIGYTRRADVRLRIKELHTTGVPFPFELVHEERTRMPVELEGKVFRRMQGCRVSDDGEFFECSPEQAMQVVNDCSRELAEDMWLDDADMGAREHVATFHAARVLKCGFLDKEHGVAWSIVRMDSENALGLLGGARSSSLDSVGARYGKDMAAGRWKLNGVAVVQAPDGSVLDGSKRLRACVSSGTEFVTLMLHGIGPDSWETMNTHRSRRLTDVMSISGHKRARVLSNAVKMVGSMRDGAWHGGNLDMAGVRGFLVENPDFEADLDVVFLHPGRHGPSHVHAAMLYLFGHVDAEASSVFMSGVHDFASLSPQDPRRILGARLEGHRSSRERLSGKDWAALFVKTWNAWRSGRGVSNLKWAVNEVFPSILGWSVDVEMPMLQQAVQDDSDWRKLHIEVRDFEPDEAAEVLEAHNGRNRTIAPMVVEKYARDMAAGRWRSNGEAVKFDEDHNLLDGQHRLGACVEADVPLRTLVISGLGRNVYDTFDTGVRRSFPDVLASRGERNCNALAAACTAMWRYRNVCAGLPMGVPSIGELGEVMEAEVDLAVSMSVSTGCFRLMPSGQATAACHLCRAIDPDKAAVFFERLATGADLGIGHPILTLREKLLRARDDGKMLTALEPMGLTILAWNAFREGRLIRQLKRPDLANFPKPI